jgi:hypothetical protein
MPKGMVALGRLVLAMRASQQIPCFADKIPCSAKEIPCSFA